MATQAPNILAGASWVCSACTYANNSSDSVCKICFTPRGGGGGGAAASAASASSPSAMTPSLLMQQWRSYGRNMAPSVAKFSQGAMHVFSNYASHPQLRMSLPGCCHPNDVLAAGRSATIVFSFAEQAIMACKAALFGDYPTMDRILQSTNPREAKGLGRKVSPFDQQLWDAHQCAIVRSVCIGKLAWPTYRNALLQTKGVIAECTRGDWVWGTALAPADQAVDYPGAWRGMNILGWSLMEARDHALQQQPQPQPQQQGQQPQLQQPQLQPPFAAPTVGFTSQQQPQQQQPQQQQMMTSQQPQPQQLLQPYIPKPSAAPTTTDEKLDPNSIKYFAAKNSFGPSAFGPLRRSKPPTSTAASNGTSSSSSSPDLSNAVRTIIEASFPDAKHMRGERNRKTVTRMLTDIYHQGLFMHGGPTSSVNATVIPAFRHVIAELNKLSPNDPKRVQLCKDLSEACLDCQQVQARVILRLYGDLTSQNETLESQLKYSLVRSKEAALQVLISRHHAPSCDYDHTKVGPELQRAHLWSGYVSLVGEALGLDGIDAARGDRFLHSALGVIRGTHHKANGGGFSSSSPFKRHKNGSNSDAALRQKVLDELSQSLDVREWLSGLLGDINNQSPDADRRIDRSCIFEWASKNMRGDFKHRIFYDDDRAAEYSDLDPSRPTDENQYEPFLSPAVLVEMLVQAGMLQARN